MIIEFDHNFVKNCLIMGKNVLFYSGCLLQHVLKKTSKNNRILVNFLF